jgi:hypothetical protein
MLWFFCPHSGFYSGEISERVVEDQEQEIAKKLEFLINEQEESRDRARRLQADKERLAARELQKKEREERERLDFLAVKEMLKKEEEERQRQDLLAAKVLFKLDPLIYLALSENFDAMIAGFRRAFGPRRSRATSHSKTTAN